jgi:uncharacterized delta-60 repeat protein
MPVRPNRAPWLWACALAITAILAAFPLATVSLASRRAFDRSFANGGISLVKPPVNGSLAGESALALAADRKGRLIVAGETVGESIYVRRYLYNGQIDPSFGDKGLRETNLEIESAANAIDVLSGGDIIVAGGTEDELVLVRYREDGSQARWFGHNGHVVTFGGFGGAGALAMGVQANGRILSAGYKRSPGDDWTGLVVANKPNGSIDPSFAGDGFAELHTSHHTEVAFSGLEVLPSGKILLGGDIGGWLLLSRLLPNGKPDPSFGGGDGIVQVAADRRCACSHANALTITPDGKPLLAGVAGESSLLARFTPNGRLDRSFGHHGIVRTLRGTRLVFNDATTQHDGRITATGFYNQRHSGEAQVAVLRYLPNGKLDHSFGHGGFFQHHFGRESIGYGRSPSPTAESLSPAGRALGRNSAKRPRRSKAHRRC